MSRNFHIRDDLQFFKHSFHSQILHEIVYLIILLQGIHNKVWKIG